MVSGAGFWDHVRGKGSGLQVLGSGLRAVLCQGGLGLQGKLVGDSVYILSSATGLLLELRHARVVVLGFGVPGRKGEPSSHTKAE